MWETPEPLLLTFSLFFYMIFLQAEEWMRTKIGDALIQEVLRAADAFVRN